MLDDQAINPAVQTSRSESAMLGHDTINRKIHIHKDVDEVLS